MNGRLRKVAVIWAAYPLAPATCPLLQRDPERPVVEYGEEDEEEDEE
jgi:hypothetical protein